MFNTDDNLWYDIVWNQPHIFNELLCNVEALYAVKHKRIHTEALHIHIYIVHYI